MLTTGPRYSSRDIVMDRDVATLPFPPGLADPTPPVALASVRLTGLVGLGLLGISATMGLAALAMNEVPSAVNTARLLLVLVGTITVGAAISMRHDLWWVWGLGRSRRFWPGAGCRLTGIHSGFYTSS